MKFRPWLIVALAAMLAFAAGPGAALAADVKAGDSITIEGAIDPGKDLFLAIASEQNIRTQGHRRRQRDQALQKRNEEARFRQGHRHSGVVHTC